MGLFLLILKSNYVGITGPSIAKTHLKKKSMVVRRRRVTMLFLWVT